MPSDFKWSESLATGVEEIDWQHKECIRLIAILLDKDLDSGDKALVKKSFDFLCKYVREHFQLEEKLMKESGYSKDDFAKHKAFHAWFRDEVNALWKSNEFGEDVAMRLKYLLITLFSQHIIGMDKHMGKHLRAKMEENQSLGERLKKMLASIIGK